MRGSVVLKGYWATHAELNSSTPFFIPDLCIAKVARKVDITRYYEVST